MEQLDAGWALIVDKVLVQLQEHISVRDIDGTPPRVAAHCVGVIGPGVEEY